MPRAAAAYAPNFTLLIPDQQTPVYVGTVEVTDDYRIFALYERLNLII